MNNSNLMATLIHDTDGISSLEIAKLTGKRHDAILRDIRNLLKQGVATHNFVESYYIDKSNKKSPCYNLTPKGCLILASGYDALLRERIINRLEELEAEKKNSTFNVPQSFSEALMLAAQQQLQIEEQQQQIAQKDAKIAKIQPKADFADAAFEVEGKVDIGMSAKILNLGFGRNTLFDKLRKAGVFFANRNEPKQRFIDAGYFEMKEKFIERDNHPGFVVTKVLVTQKGLAYINHLFGGNPSDGKLIKIV